MYKLFGTKSLWLCYLIMSITFYISTKVYFFKSLLKEVSKNAILYTSITPYAYICVPPTIFVSLRIFIFFIWFFSFEYESKGAASFSQLTSRAGYKKREFLMHTHTHTFAIVIIWYMGKVGLSRYFRILTFKLLELDTI